MATVPQPEPRENLLVLGKAVNPNQFAPAPTEVEDVGHRLLSPTRPPGDGQLAADFVSDLLRPPAREFVLWSPRSSATRFAIASLRPFFRIGLQVAGR